MRLPVFYASPTMVRRWVEGSHWPGIYLRRRGGRARVILPTGRRVTSMYGLVALGPRLDWIVNITRHDGTSDVALSYGHRPETTAAVLMVRNIGAEPWTWTEYPLVGIRSYVIHPMNEYGGAGVIGYPPDRMSDHPGGAA